MENLAKRIDAFKMNCMNAKNDNENSKSDDFTQLVEAGKSAKVQCRQFDNVCSSLNNVFSTIEKHYKQKANNADKETENGFYKVYSWAAVEGLKIGELVEFLRTWVPSRVDDRNNLCKVVNISFLTTLRNELKAAETAKAAAAVEAEKAATTGDTSEHEATQLELQRATERATAAADELTTAADQIIAFIKSEGFKAVENSKNELVGVLVPLNKWSAKTLGTYVKAAAKAKAAAEKSAK